MKKVMTKTVLNLALIALCSAGIASDEASKATQEVWQRHINAWNARDLNGIVADYSQDSVVVVVNRAYRGKEEIHELFHRLFVIFDSAEEHEIDPALIDGKLVYLTWRAKVKGVKYPIGTDSFFIEGGKIRYQTITSDSRLFE